MNILLLDRDGVLIADQGYDCSPDRISLLPGVVDGLRRLADNYRFFVVSNQSAIARGRSDRATVEACNARLVERLEQEGVTIEDVVYCPHGPDDGCHCRKPAPGLWDELVARHGLSSTGLVMVGNRDSDIAFGQAISARSFLVLPSGERYDGPDPEARVVDLIALADFLSR